MWKIVDRPGCFGKRRPEIIKKYDEKYGKGNWAELWEVDNKMLEFDDAIKYYEDAYVEFLNKYTAITDILCMTAYDVYDNAESNVKSGFDYKKQETVARHYQDISVRRAVHRIGRSFTGKVLLQIRSSANSVGALLSPGVVPFHLPHLIKKPELTGWWAPSSIESFWQSNKIIAVKTEDPRVYRGE